VHPGADGHAELHGEKQRCLNRLALVGRRSLAGAVIHIRDVCLPFLVVASSTDVMAITGSRQAVSPTTESCQVCCLISEAIYQCVSVEEASLEGSGLHHVVSGSINRSGGSNRK